jgi:MFS family permease
LLVSTSTGTIWVITNATASRWFDKKRGLALGIAGSGIGLGAIVMAPFATYLISNFGWRIAYLTIGIIVWLIVIPLSRLLKRGPNKIGALPDGIESSPGRISISETSEEYTTEHGGLSLQEACRTCSFWVFGSMWLLYAFCTFLILTHIVPYATDMGIPAMQAATILSLIGASSLAGRVLMGRVSDSIGRKKIAITCALFAGGAMVWLTWSQDLWMLYVFGVVYGFCNGGLDPSLASLIGDIFGMRSIGVIMGILEIAWGAGAAIGPAIGGFVFDVNESYSIAFIAGAFAMLLLALLTAVIRREN